MPSCACSITPCSVATSFLNARVMPQYFHAIGFYAWRTRHAKHSNTFWFSANSALPAANAFSETAAKHSSSSHGCDTALVKIFFEGACLLQNPYIEIGNNWMQSLCDFFTQIVIHNQLFVICSRSCIISRTVGAYVRAASSTKINQSRPHGCCCLLDFSKCRARARSNKLWTSGSTDASFDAWKSWCHWQICKSIVINIIVCSAFLL